MNENIDETEEELGEAGMAERFAAHQAEEEGEQEPAFEGPEVTTLPAIKPRAENALKRIGLAIATVTRLLSYKDLVLADLTDKKAAKEIDARRLEVKRARVAWERECEDGREESNAISKGWTTAQKVLADPFKEVEKHLAEQVEAHEREMARIAREAEQARQEKIQSRLNAMVAAGLRPEIGPATTLEDDAWGIYLGDAIAAKEAQERRDAEIQAAISAAKAVADELTALGDECTLGEAMGLTGEQRQHRLETARRDDHARKEAQRIKDEEAATERQRIAEADKAARERLERGYRRGRELAMLGSIGLDAEALADLTEEAFQVALETARQEKADRDERIAEERRQQDERDAELARLRKAEADRLQKEREAIEQREREAEAAAEQSRKDAAAAREQAEQELEAARLEALRPEREQIAAWARATLDAMPSTPNITDSNLLRTMRNTVEGIRTMLLDLEDLGNRTSP